MQVLSVEDTNMVKHRFIQNNAEQKDSMSFESWGGAQEHQRRVRVVLSHDPLHSSTGVPINGVQGIMGQY